MAQIIWTDPTLSNLNDIADYISLSNFEAAQGLIRTIFEKVDRLKQHPTRSGRKPSELRSLVTARWWLTLAIFSIK
ncbi:MAG: type II toxin-antitoxin system RelE/ParE family toxin [Pseudomonadales bacterium]|nr:type II toxin-antitoxin system RelE/ParE family toxin [Pseudomonadales bacterium]